LDHASFDSDGLLLRSGCDAIGAYTPSPGMDPTRPDPIPKLTHPLPNWTRPYPTRYRSFYIIFRCGSDPIRSEAGAYNLLPECIRSYPIRCRSLYILPGMDPILSDPIPKFMPHSSGMDPTRPDPIPKLTHLLPKWTRPYPTRYRGLYIIFRCGSEPIRSEAGAYTCFTRMYPILSDPMPKLTQPLSEGTRSCPIRHRSLYTLSRNGSDPDRSDTRL
jgi:hypothetical protein